MPINWRAGKTYGLCAALIRGRCTTLVKIMSAASSRSLLAREVELVGARAASHLAIDIVGVRLLTVAGAIHHGHRRAEAVRQVVMPVAALLMEAKPAP